jgi:hypothetical protein
MSQHTIEPWTHDETRVYFPNCLGGFDLRNCPNPEATARRISACVNACKGIGIESLERFTDEHKPEKGFGLYREAAIEAQRDELLETLQTILPWVDEANSRGAIKRAIREAIAKAVQP